MKTSAFSLTRRNLTGAAAALTAVVLGTFGLAAHAHASEATNFVKTFGGELVEIINSDAPLDEKKQKVLPLLQRNVDIPEIAKFCLGRYWRTATPAQQKHYIALFDHVLVNAVTDKIGDYRGVTFTVTTSSTAPEGGELVSAKIDRPGQPEADMQLLIVNHGSPKVVDMVGEGASLRLTQRQDYASYLSRHGGDVDALNSALERQLANHH